jgi:hypothetical protein
VTAGLLAERGPRGKAAQSVSMTAAARAAVCRTRAALDRRYGNIEATCALLQRRGVRIAVVDKRELRRWRLDLLAPRGGV